MSEFGADQIAQVTGTRPPMIYHGVSTDDFYPITPLRPGSSKGHKVTSKEACRRSFEYPDDRIMVLRTDRHMPRKIQNRLIRAMEPVFDTVPNLDLVLHCAPVNRAGDCWTRSRSSRGTSGTG